MIFPFRCLSNFLGHCCRECPDGYQVHHIIQNAAVKNLTCARGTVTEGNALTVILCGGRGSPGSPHDCANLLQRSMSPRQGTLAGEYLIARDALEAARDCSATTNDPTQIFGLNGEIDFQMTCSSNFFENRKGCNPNQLVNHVRVN